MSRTKDQYWNEMMATSAQTEAEHEYERMMATLYDNFSPKQCDVFEKLMAESERTREWRIREKV